MELSGDTMVSPEEMAEIASEKSEEYDIHSSQIVPGSGPNVMGKQPDLSNCEAIGGWNETYWITDNLTGVAYAKVDNAVVLYRGYESGPTDRWTYPVWLWSTGIPLDTFWSPGGVDWMHNKFNVKTDEYDVVKFDPNTKERVNERRSAIGVEYNGVGLSGTSDVYQGHITTVSADVDDAGHVKTKFFGHGTDGAQGDCHLNGAIAMSSEEKLPFDRESGIPGASFEWDTNGYYGV